MTGNYNLKNLIIFSLTIYLILIFTNQFFSLELSSNKGFVDQLEYLKIFNNAPYLPEEKVNPSQAQRFFFPYLIGLILDFAQIKNHLYTFLIISNIFLNLLILQIFLLIISHIGLKKNISLIIISALIFNAYYFRVSLFAPMMISDYMFSYGLLLIVFFFIKNKKRYFYIGLILCSLSRQTSIILNLLFLALIIYNFFKKNKININIFIYGILINLILFFILKNIAGNFSNSISTNLSTSISGLFLLNYSLIDFGLFFIYLVNSNLIIFLLSFLLLINFNFYKKLLKLEVTIILFLSLAIWIQPILGGPKFTGTNISRLTIISLPIFLLFFSIIFKDLEIRTTHTIIIICLLFIASLHHNYTYLFKYFFEIKNFYFVGVNFFAHIMILMLLNKNYNKNYIKKI